MLNRNSIEIPMFFETENRTMKYLPYPEADEMRVGIKVTWHYYKDEKRAKECAKIAEHNRDVDRSNGYDHGYCSPGEILGPDRQTFYPGLYEVCTC